MTTPVHVFGGTNYIRNDGHVPRILNLSSDFATNLVHNFYSNLSECSMGGQFCRVSRFKGERLRLVMLNFRFTNWHLGSVKGRVLSHFGELKEICTVFSRP